ncbi:hypothetical protein Kisp01_70590 [Kineosporia sp. NBRC 101677]|uniref:type IV secretory system conjugative DNA transfer family protein n=1 Tax=Kineosporia sp. NBRC 101677 TaxID=3032197 RepID=UPI0024A374E5|nr:hypothetical protein [Kineosporia sp. NBRC 101677]GLY20045.1 hypothetical protein Kisp01_70590 [Kineosporia sp. NBRC 101677]
MTVHGLPLGDRLLRWSEDLTGADSNTVAVTGLDALAVDVLDAANTETRPGFSDPAGEVLQALARVWTGALEAVRAHPVQVAAYGVLAVVLLAQGAHLWRRWKVWQRRRALEGAQEILILPPAEVDAHGVDLWWSQVAGLLRRRGWRRLVYGPAYIAWELRWVGRELTIVVWVPASVPVRPIAAAARAAWPGTSTTIRPSASPIPVLGGPADAAASHTPTPHHPPAQTQGPGSHHPRTPPEHSEGQPEDPPEGQPEGQQVGPPMDRGRDRRGSSPAAPAQGLEPVARRRGTMRAPQATPGSEVFEVGRQVSARLPGWYTFRSASDHRVDPMRALLEQGASFRADQSACVQILVRRPSRRQVARLRAGAVGLKTGRTQQHGGPLGTGLSGASAGALSLIGTMVLTVMEIVLSVIEAIFSAVTGGPTARTSAGSRSRTGSTGAPAHRAATSPLQERDAGPALDKVRTGLLWDVSIRIAVTQTRQNTAPPRKQQPPAGTGGRLRTFARLSRHPERAGRTERGRSAGRAERERILAGLNLSAHALAAALVVHDERNGLVARPLRSPRRALENRQMGEMLVMGGGELAGLAALPTDVAVPGLDRAQARSVPAPTVVASGGRGVKVLGRSGPDGRAVGVAVADARQHLHVLGSTGVGKSTLLCRQILTDINARRGVVLIDPKGDLALDVLDRMPAHAVSRVILIDPDQPGGSAGFNPLQVRPGADPALQVDNLAAIFANIFARHWGPRIDDALRVSCLTLMRHPGPVLTSIPALLNNKQFRSRMTVDLDDPAGLGGFWEWYESSPAGLRSQVIAPVLARLRSFLLRDFVRHTIGRPESTFDMNTVLDGGILIARIPKGQLGEDASKLMGSMLLASVWQAAIARAAIPEHQRRDATVYTDEAHNILNLSGGVSDMLAEARGYHLSFVLAHQNLAQLPTEIQQSLSANARNKILFTCSPEDAAQLERHTLPDLDQRDLSHLGPYTAAARLVAGNRETRAFTLKTMPLPDGNPAARQRVRDHVRKTGPLASPRTDPDPDPHTGPNTSPDTGTGASGASEPPLTGHQP